MRKRLQIFCLLLLPCLALMGILGPRRPVRVQRCRHSRLRR